MFQPIKLFISSVEDFPLVSLFGNVKKGPGHRWDRADLNSSLLIVLKRAYLNPKSNSVSILSRFHSILVYN